MKFISAALVALAICAVGCSTTQQVSLAKANPTRVILTAAQAPDEGNSSAMDGHLEAALRTEGISLKRPVSASTRTSSDVDAIVSYVDVWRWDMVMYLQRLSVKMYDAQSGDLLASGEWKDSPLHGFRDAKMAVQELVTEMIDKVRGATKPIAAASNEAAPAR